MSAESQTAETPPAAATGRFDVIRLLGTGGGGRVSLVRDRKRDGALRALKSASHGDGQGNVQGDAAAVRRGGRDVLEEARILSAVRHPAIPRLYELGLSDTGLPWLLMEYIEPAPEADTAARDPVAVARGLLDVLAYLHRHGWLHHDVKPANVLVSISGRVVLVDYGLAARENEVVPLRGTLPFVAPDVLAGAVPDRRSDLWSLAAVLLQLMTGREFAPNATIGPEDVPAEGALPAAWLRNILLPQAAKRFGSAEEALRELDAALGATSRPLPPRPLPRAPEPVGRSAELATLLRHLGHARAPAADPSGEPAAARSAERGVGAMPGMVLVRGPTGVGKSRLLGELRLRGLAKGWRPLLESCTEERHSALPALGSALETMLATAPPDSAAARRRGRAVASLLAARSDQSAAETAARFLLERASEGGGLLLGVEDLQAASALTLDVLALLARGVAGSHVVGVPPNLLVVATLTDGVTLPEQVEETVLSLEAEGVLSQIPLRPLPPAAVGRLARAILGPRTDSDRIGEVLHAHGGSLPLFAEELLQRLVKDRALFYERGRWHLDSRQSPRLPRSLIDALTSRIGSLPPDELRAVQLLAIHERPLPRARANRLLGGQSAVTLASLEERGMAAPAVDGNSISLVHALIGQAAVSLLSARGRARAHDQVAATLPPEDPAGPVRRAYHVARGTNPDRAIRAATEAARRLRSDGEPGRGAEFVRQALRLLPEGDPRIPRLRRSLGELLVSSGRPEAAANVFRDLLTDERDDATRARLFLGLADALVASGATTEVAQVCAEGRDALRDAARDGTDGDVEDVRVGLLARLAGAQRNAGDVRDAIETVREALRLIPDSRAPERAALLSLLGNAYVQLGDLQRARQFHEGCLTLCRALSHRRGMATALHNLGVVRARTGARDAALDLYRQSLRLARRARDLGGVAQTLGNLANLRAAAGDFERAERLQLKSLALRRRIGDVAGVAVTQGNIAGLKRARGRLGSALTLLRTAARTLRTLGDVQGEVEFLLQIAAVHLFAGDDAGARPILARAGQRARAASLRRLEARAEMLWGRLERRDRPESDEWAKRLGRAVQLHDQVGDRSGMAESLLETALGERARGRRGSALRSWRAAMKLVSESASDDLRARAALVRARLDADGESSTEGLEGAEHFHGYATSSGRRDYQVASGLALARARLYSGDAVGAAAIHAETRTVEDELSGSLPPALRRVRDSGPVPRRLEDLRDEIERHAEELGEAGTQLSGEDMEAERLLKLLQINKELNLARDLHALLDRIMDAATELTGAERGYLVLVDDGKISFQTARNFRREEVNKPELKISSNIIKRVMRAGEPVLTDNATEDARFQEFKSVSRLDLKSIVSIPFRLGTEIIGAMYLDNSIQRGAFGSGDLQFLTALADQAALAIRNMRQAKRLEEANKALTTDLEKKESELERASHALAERTTRFPYDEIVSQSPQMREMLLLVDKVVQTQVPVLIQGDSGTGKELIARAIHHYGKRTTGPFVTVNCGAIPDQLMESEFFGHMRGAFTGAVENKKGLFEAATGGTLFLDEIGETSLDMQKKLLRVLQEREVRPVGGKGTVKVDVRVIAATNRNLREMMETSAFRQDLYYRIAVINVDLPPLRERRGDVPLLVAHFAERAVAELGLPDKPFDQAALDALCAYEWPGNVRELDNEVKKAMTLSDDRVTIEDLSRQIRGGGPSDDSGGPPLEREEGETLKESLERMDKTLIQRALEKTGGNQTRAAKELGISRVWLRKKMEKYGLLSGR